MNGSKAYALRSMMKCIFNCRFTLAYAAAELRFYYLWLGEGRRWWVRGEKTQQSGTALQQQTWREKQLENSSHLRVEEMKQNKHKLYFVVYLPKEGENQNFKHKSTTKEISPARHTHIMLLILLDTTWRKERIIIIEIKSKNYKHNSR